jgi:hypothetical protein
MNKMRFEDYLITAIFVVVVLVWAWFATFPPTDALLGF